MPNTYTYTYSYIQIHMYGCPVPPVLADTHHRIPLVSPMRYNNLSLSCSRSLSFCFSFSLTRILRSSCGSNKSLTANKSTRINSNVQRRAWPDFIYDIATKTLTAKCPPDSRKSKRQQKKQEVEEERSIPCTPSTGRRSVANSSNLFGYICSRQLLT